MEESKKLFIQLDGKKYQIQTQHILGKTWVHLNGKTICYEPTGTRAKRKTATSKVHSGDLIAPMPGKITKILKTKSERVKKGDPVLVMEAMKMEYTLKSDTEGLIESLFCKLGEQVILGKVLAHISTSANKQGDV